MTDAPPNVISLWGEADPYSTFNREERNCAAMLYHALLLPQNMNRFLRAVGSPITEPGADFELYFEYAYLRDLWFRQSAHGTAKANDRKRQMIIRFLQPTNSSDLLAMSVKEFNEFFGATPTPSADYIQYPGKWSVMRFSPNIDDHQEFRRTCKFKWAFNIKPDLVIQLDPSHAVCIEAKYESGESVYPATSAEKAEFKKRGCAYLGQDEVQHYLMSELLGFDTQFLALILKPSKPTEHYQDVTWKEAFASLDTAGCPSFIKAWSGNLG
ncbi:MAG: hypothetical protein NVS3B21_29940 [Acidimicrobiales bacterium]